MDPNEAINFLNGGQAPQKNSLTPVTDMVMARQMQPETSAQQYLSPADQELKKFSESQLPLGENLSLQQGLARKESFIRENTQDVPLDVDTGMDSWTRIGMAFRRAQDDKLKYLQNKFGEKNVRLSNDGEPVVRIKDSETGKTRDVLVNEYSMSARDLLDIAGAAPEIIAGALAARGGNPRGLSQIALKLTKMAAMTEAAGALKDVGVRVMDKSDIQPGEIAAERSKMALGDIMFGGVLAGAAKMGLKVLSPFSESGPLQADLKAAQEYFKKKGYDLPATPGELSGNSFLLRAEAMAKQKPGSSIPFEKIVEQRTAELKKIQNAALGLPDNATEADIARMATDEAVGEKAMGALADKISPLQTGAKEAQKDLAATGTSRIKEILARVAGKGNPVDTVEVGRALRESAMARREVFRQQSAREFGAVAEHPSAQQQNLPAGDLATKASALLKEMPAKDVVEQVDTGMVDEFGRAITRDEKGREILRQFVPTDVVSKLKELSTLKDQNFKLSELLKMRTDVSNEIAKGEAIPGVDTKYLTQIRGMLTEAIEGGLDKLGDPELKTLWKTANDNYAKGVKPFKQAGIAELFRDIEQGNYIGDNAVVQRTLSGPKGTDIYNAYREFYGASSPEMTGIRRAVVDQLLGKSTEVGSEFVSGQQFVKNLQNLLTENPQIAKDVIQGESGKLMHIGLMLEAGAQKLGKIAENADVYIPTEKLEKEFLSGELTSQKLLALFEKEKALNTAYQNEILKQVGSGKFIGDKIDPTEFVSRLSTQSTPKNIKEVVGALADRPEIVEEIRRKTIKQILDKASTGAMNSNGSRSLSARGIADALGDATQQERYKAIIGAETFQDLQMAAKVLKPSEMKERAFSAAGGLSAGSQIAGLIERGEMKYIERGLANFVLSTIYTSPLLRKWAANNLVAPETSAAAMNYVIASTPFLEATAREFGDQAQSKMKQIKSGLDRYEREQGSRSRPAQTEDQRRKEFEAFLKSQ